LLLDEITVDMDVVGRLDLLEFFKQECAERGATIIYATHIFDGMQAWPTHLAYVEGGAMVRGGPVAEVPDLQSGRKLLHTVEGWLREEMVGRRAREAAAKAAPVVVKRKEPVFPSRHMAYCR
jgi:CCR4-NOT complex subunit CAF16